MTVVVVLIIHGQWKFFAANLNLEIETSEQGIRIKCNDEV